METKELLSLKSNRSDVILAPEVCRAPYTKYSDLRIVTLLLVKIPQKGDATRVIPATIVGVDTPTPYEVEVTGWDADGESIAWSGYGQTEDDAIADAKDRGGIIEVGEVTIVRCPQ